MRLKKSALRLLSCFCIALFTFQSCAYNDFKDPLYLDFLEYQYQMKKAAERGEISQAEATTRIYNAQVAYNERREKKIAQRKAIMAGAFADYGKAVEENSKVIYPQQPQRIRTNCTTYYSGNMAQTDCH